MAKPGQPLPDAFGLLPTLEQVAAAPPRRSPITVRQHLRDAGITMRTAEGYPKKVKQASAYVSRFEWESARPCGTRTITNVLRDGGLEPQPPS